MAPPDDRDPRAPTDSRNGRAQAETDTGRSSASGGGAPATRQLEELQIRLAALQRFTTKTPRSAASPLVPSTSDAVYEAERELAELRLAVREQFLRAESLALELTQTQGALTQTAAEAEHAIRLLRESEGRAERQRLELDSLRATVEDLREKERSATARAELLQRQITELTVAQIDLLKAHRESGSEPAAAPPPPPAAAPAPVAMFRGRPIEQPNQTAAKPPEPEAPPAPATKPRGMFRGRPID